jgi:toxin ParE1/3/4
VKWYLGIIEAIEKLDELAERCPIAPEDSDIQKGIRHLIIGDYRVLYIVDHETVQVLHVRHSRHHRKL